jgi:hypothetical protein
MPLACVRTEAANIEKRRNKGSKRFIKKAKGNSPNASDLHDPKILKN